MDHRAGGFPDFSDKLIEDSTRQVGRAIWREMKSGAQKPFEPGRDGTETINAFLQAFAAHKKLHIVGHSTGAILLASLLQALGRFPDAPRIDTCHLLAPACNHDTFKTIDRPFLQERDKEKFGIDQMAIYILKDKLERADTVTPLYLKSLLYLVSNAFEEIRGERILGMQIFNRYLRNLPGIPVFRIETSGGSLAESKKTTSETHGGFDNDIATMNDILRSILKAKPTREFDKKTSTTKR